MSLIHGKTHREFTTELPVHDMFLRNQQRRRGVGTHGVSVEGYLFSYPVTAVPSSLSLPVVQSKPRETRSM